MDKLIMEFQIFIDNNDITQMQTNNGAVTVIPFTGRVNSDIFSGTIRPGAVDIQLTNTAGVRHMCASYIFDGKDASGTPCKLFVENHGYFERDHICQTFESAPRFMTDSKILAPYLHANRFRAEGIGDEKGVMIRIFDIWGDDSDTQILDKNE